MGLAGVVLAAGAGRRYGMPKALVTVDGRLLVRRAAATLAEAGCGPVLVVIGAAAAEVRAAAPELTYVDNAAWATGLGSSLRAGLDALARSPVDAAVVLLADMPGVTAAAVRRVAAGAGVGTLATGGYHGRGGHPVVLGRDHWAGAAAMAAGDTGARAYLRTREVVVVEVGDLADDTDLDVPVSGRA